MPHITSHHVPHHITTCPTSLTCARSTLEVGHMLRVSSQGDSDQGEAYLPRDQAPHSPALPHAFMPRDQPPAPQALPQTHMPGNQGAPPPSFGPPQAAQQPPLAVHGRMPVFLFEGAQQGAPPGPPLPSMLPNPSVPRGQGPSFLQVLEITSMQPGGPTSHPQGGPGQLRLPQQNYGQVWGAQGQSFQSYGQSQGQRQGWEAQGQQGRQGQQQQQGWEVQQPQPQGHTYAAQWRLQQLQNRMQSQLAAQVAVPPAFTQPQGPAWDPRSMQQFQPTAYSQQPVSQVVLPLPYPPQALWSPSLPPHTYTYVAEAAPPAVHTKDALRGVPGGESGGGTGAPTAAPMKAPRGGNGREGRAGPGGLEALSQADQRRQAEIAMWSLEVQGMSQAVGRAEAAHQVKRLAVGS